MGAHLDNFLHGITPWVYLIYRLAQFALGLTVYAEAVAIISVSTTLLYFALFYFERRHAKDVFTYHKFRNYPVFPLWDFILFILYLVVFILFGTMFIGENPAGDAGIQRMKTAVSIDAACWVMWLGSGTLVGYIWWLSGGRSYDMRLCSREKGSLWTDRDRPNY